MPKLPKAREVEKVLRSLKFLRYQLSRQSGSYAMHKNSEGKIIVPSVHGGREISVSVFGVILNDLGINKEEFWKNK